MSNIENLRIVEREALLVSLKESLASDPRVLTAWLHGSFGRGEADAWSDLDVWIVHSDDSEIDSFEMARALGTPIFIVKAPQNAPLGGKYLMAAYDAPSGPHLVDWYFQPLRFASAGSSRKMLVGDLDLPAVPKASCEPSVWIPSPAEDAEKKAALFWAMILIQAKRIARKPNDPTMEFEGFILSLLSAVAEWRGIKTTVNEDLDLSKKAKFKRLRWFGETMLSVAPDLSGPAPSVEKFLTTVERFLETVG